MERTDAITCFQMGLEPELPGGVCRICSEETLAATQLRQLVRTSAQRWHEAAESLASLEIPLDQSKVYYVFMSDEAPTVLKDTVDHVKDTKQAFERLTKEIDQPKTRPYEKKTRLKCECPDCGKTFKVPYDLNAHLKRTKNRVCIHCGTVVEKENLKRHLLKSHKKVLFDCNKCYKLFDREAALDWHVREVHNDSALECNLCGYGFTSDRALRAHMYSHTLFHCSNCKQSFENAKCFRHHKRSCKDETIKQSVFQCADCGNTYDKKPSLRIHIVQKHMNVLPWVCTHCGKRTSTMTHLRSHMQTHQTPEQRNTYKCNLCDSVFTTSLGHSLHQRTHTGEKPYICDTCGDRFISASRRLDHIKRRHRSEKEMKHGCTECPARFIRPFELRKHITLMHKGEKDGKSVRKRQQFRRIVSAAVPL